MSRDGHQARLLTSAATRDLAPRGDGETRKVVWFSIRRVLPSEPTMSDDPTLLRRFTSEHSELAFAEIVERHVNLVYSAALRQVGGDAHLARDVSQQVFVELARNAPALVRHPVLTGWLYTTAHHTACKTMRAVRRRQAREQEAYAMEQTTSDREPSADWSRLRPVLDEVMQDLGDRDRTAVLLRYFEARPFSEVGAALSLNENAARMRVERALEKMRQRLARRGVTSTTGALGALLAQQAVTAAPAGLGSAVAAAAVASAAAVGGGGFLGLVQFMGLTKLQAGVAGALIVAAGAGVLVQQQANAALREEVASLEQKAPNLAALREKHQRLATQEISSAELERLRADSGETARLRTGIADLRQKLAGPKRPSPSRTKANPAPAIAANQNSTGSVDQPPRPVSTVSPAYPLGMMFEGSGGKVLVKITVDENGTVTDVSADDDAEPELAAAAMDALYQ